MNENIERVRSGLRHQQNIILEKLQKQRVEDFYAKNRYRLREKYRRQGLMTYLEVRDFVCIKMKRRWKRGRYAQFLPISEYLFEIPDEALLIYDHMKQTGDFGNFYIVRAAYGPRGHLANQDKWGGKFEFPIKWFCGMPPSHSAHQEIRDDSLYGFDYPHLVGELAIHNFSRMYLILFQWR